MNENTWISYQLFDYARWIQTDWDGDILFPFSLVIVWFVSMCFQKTILWYVHQKRLSMEPWFDGHGITLPGEERVNEICPLSPRSVPILLPSHHRNQHKRRHSLLLWLRDSDLSIDHHKRNGSSYSNISIRSQRSVAAHKSLHQLPSGRMDTIMFQTKDSVSDQVTFTGIQYMTPFWKWSRYSLLCWMRSCGNIQTSISDHANTIMPMGSPWHSPDISLR